MRALTCTTIGVCLLVVVLVLPLTATAKPIGLTDENFDAQTASGLWLIIAFDGNADKAIMRAAQSQVIKNRKASLKIGSINCRASQDLCDGLLVESTPFALMYDGAQDFTHYDEGTTTPASLTQLVQGGLALLRAHGGDANSDAPASQEQPGAVDDDTAAEPANEVEQPEHDGHIVVLTESNFDTLLQLKPFFVKFYAPWCGHCKRMHPAWKELAKKATVGAAANFFVGQVDCTTHNTCDRFGIRGYPTLLYIDAKQGKYWKYSGDRTVEAWEQWALSSEKGEAKVLPKAPGSEEGADIEGDESAITSLTDDKFDDALKDGRPYLVDFFAPWCGHCKKLAPELAKLAVYARDRMDSSVGIASVDVTLHTELSSRFGIKFLPTVYYIPSGADGQMYEQKGERTFAALRAFIEGGWKTAPAVPFPATKLEIDGEARPEDMVQLTDANFEALTAEGDTLVKVFAPWCGHCKSIATEWAQFATYAVQQGLPFRVAELDGDSNPKWAPLMAPQGYPTIGVVSGGKFYEFWGDRSPQAWLAFASGAWRTAKSRPVDQPEAPTAVDEAVEAGAEVEEGREEDVETLTSATFDEKVGNGDRWFVAFTAPWCGFCKQLKPEFAKLATRIKGSFPDEPWHVANVDATENEDLRQQYAEQGYPTIILFEAGQAWEYGGDRSAEDMLLFVRRDRTAVAASGTHLGYNQEAAAGAESAVVPLGADNFFDTVSDGNVWMVAVTAPWCGFCKRMKPAYVGLAAKAKAAFPNGSVRVAEVDGSTKDSDELTTLLDARSFPTLFVVADNKRFYYSGDRTTEDMLKFVSGAYKEVDSKPLLRELPPLHDPDTLVLTDATLPAALSQGGPILLDFYASWCGFCKQLAPIYAKLATRVKHELGAPLRVAKVDVVACPAAAKAFAIKYLPTLYLVDGDSMYRYEKAVNTGLEELEAWVTSGYRSEKKRPVPTMEVLDDSLVTELTQSNWDQQLGSASAPALVEFFAPWCGHCKKLAPTWTKVAHKALQEAPGSLVAKVDATQNEDLTRRFGVRGYPTVVKVHNGRYWTFSGARTEAAFLSFLAEQHDAATGTVIPPADVNAGKSAEELSADVVTLTDANFDATLADDGRRYIVAFKAPWCGFCKKLTPTWGALATAAKADPDAYGNGVVAQVDVQAETNLSARFNVKSLPTILLFSGRRYYRYAGDRELDAFKAFMNGGWRKAESFKVGMDPRISAADVGMPSVVSLTDDTFDARTRTSDRWLVALSSPWCGPCKELAPTLEAMAGGEGKLPFSIAYVDCARYRATCDRFGVTSLPTVVVVHDGRFAAFAEASATAQALQAFATEAAVSKPIVSIDAAKKAKQAAAAAAAASQEQAGANAGAEDTAAVTGDVFDLTAEAWDTMVKEEQAWLVSFCSPYVGLCKALTPVLAQVSGALAGTGARVGSVNKFTDADLVKRFQVKAVPTLFVFHKGSQHAYPNSGAKTAEALTKFVKGVIGGGHDEL